MLIVVLVVLAALLTGLVLWWRSMAATQRALNARDPELAVVVAQIRERQIALAEPTLGLVPADKPGLSKLGGRPDLPAGVAHPQGERGARKFLAQLDLAEVRAAGYEDAQIVEIVALVAENCFTNFLNEVAKTDIDFPVVLAAEAA